MVQVRATCNLNSQKSGIMSYIVCVTIFVRNLYKLSEILFSYTICSAHKAESSPLSFMVVTSFSYLLLI